MGRPLLLNACIEMAAEMTRTTASASLAASCPRSAARIGAKVSGSGSARRLSFSGAPQRIAKPAVTTSCTRKARGYVLRFRARKKGASLRSVVGDRLRLGLVSPADATASTPVRLTFRR